MMDMNNSLNTTSNQVLTSDSFRVFEEVRIFNKISCVLTPVIIGFLLFIGLLGNILVIFVSITTQRIITNPVHSILVLNLAVADLVYLLVSTPYQAISFTVSGWIYGAFLCRALYYFSTLSMAVSIFTMCSLALMRFIALMMPFKVQTTIIATSGKLTGFLIIGIVWILASVLALPNIIYFELKVVSWNDSDPLAKPVLECRWDNIQAHNVNTILLLVFTYVIPFVLVTVLYLLIGREIFCYMRKKAVNVRGTQSERAEYIKTTVMVFCLILAFLVCWFPHHLYTMIRMSKIYKDQSYAVTRTIMKLVGLFFSYAHACVNPIIYTFASPGLRESLRKSLKNNQSSHFGMKTWPRSRKNGKYSGGRPISPKVSLDKVMEESNSDRPVTTTMLSRLTLSVRRDVSSNSRKILEKSPFCSAAVTKSPPVAL